MTDQLLLIFFVIITYEFLLHFRFINIVNSNFKIYSRLFRLVKYKNISDYKKEKIIFIYLKIIFCLSIKIFIIILGILILIFPLSFFSNSFLGLIISFYGFIEFSIIFFIYYFFRNKYA